MMKISASLVYALSYIINNVRHRKTRTWLSIIAIVIGIGSIVVLISLSNGMNKAIREEFEKLGTNNIIVKPGQITGALQSDVVTAKLGDKDLKVIKQVRGVRYASGFIIKRLDVSFRGETKSLNVFGVGDDQDSKGVIKSLFIFNIEEGRDLKSKYDAILGYKTANEVFDDKIKVGDKIKINGTTFRVVGIQEKSGSRIHDYYVRINKDTLKELVGEDEVSYSSIFVIADERYNINKIEESIKEKLRKARGVKKDNEDFSVELVTKIVESFSNIINMINLILVSIAMISLVVGGVGIMNTSFTAVLERTKEIAVMKAVGAKNYYIMLLFCFESGIISLTGGIIGIVLGLLLSKVGSTIINHYLEGITITPYLSIGLIFFLFLFSFMVGVISGLVPAYKASKLKPVEGLRYE